MQVLRVQYVHMTMIDEIGTERSIQVLEISKGPVQPSGFWRNQEIMFGREEASSENLEVIVWIIMNQ